MKSLLSNTLSQNFISLFLLQVANYIFPLLIWPILSNYLGIEQFGLLLLALSMLMISNMITDFGFNLSATHNISKNRENKIFICSLLTNIYVLKTVLSILVSVVFFIYYQFSENDNLHKLDYISIILLILIVFFQSWQCPWFFQGIERMKYVTKIIVLSKIIYLLSLVLILPYYSTINSVLLCYLLNQIFISYFYMYSVYKEKFSFGRFNLYGILKELKYSSNFFISRVAVSIYTTGNVLLLGYFHSPHIVGLYGSAEKLYGAGSGVASIVSQAMYPYTTRTGNLSLLLKLVLLIFFPFCIGCYVVSFFSAEIMALIFGEPFIDGGIILDYFLFLMCITFLSVSIGYPGFAAIKRVYLANYTVIIGAVCHFIGILYLYLVDNIYPLTVIFLVIITESIILLLRIGLLFYYRNKRSL
ncbi:hypothetical protein A6B43_03045 [Vespertiliibacter pulmonis]|uniref:PST family polysaccharide transporter n=1 Tax=Vespertiliibacter pulmonis TaxID=1443036 RepID=A0A3N4VZW6_9PAST|nr:oligosaccharide flippase family protein [Vespertiliibacter pulmonis]QLB20576.1 hypothetical protein A6B43_03045 [Vespertiliibacter pulmonis]RPE82707.1 PST family polysaccharide transporter [Vespertiliibacter pulmonis]